MLLYCYFSMCCIACWSCRIAVAVVLGSLSMIHGRKQDASLLKILQFTSHCWGWAAQAAYLAILDISIDHYSPSTMQVMYWFIILNMKLTLNHAVVDLSHALTRKSIALLPIILCKKIVSYICHHYHEIFLLLICVSKQKVRFVFYFKGQSVFPPPNCTIMLSLVTPKCNTQAHPVAHLWRWHVSTERWIDILSKFTKLKISQTLQGE